MSHPNDLGHDPFVPVTAGHFVAHRQFALGGHAAHLGQLYDAGREFVADAHVGTSLRLTGR